MNETARFFSFTSMFDGDDIIRLIRAMSSPSNIDVNEKNLAVSFIQFIRQKVSANQCSEDQIEGLEVAVQCLEAAFGLTDANYAFQPSKPLIDIFKAAEGLPSGETELPMPTDAEIEHARQMKEDGNELMKQSRFDEAVHKYNEAIKLHRDPVYFCNRAAAYCRLDQFDLAIQDCRTALALDPKYSKAYGRMGLALSCQNRYEQAVEAYKKALELEPDQESYKNNLKIAEEKVKEFEQATRQQAQQQGAPNPMFGGLGNFDIGQMLNNPAMMNVATQLMTDPAIQNLMSSMMGAMSQQGGGAQGFGNLMAAGQQLASQMQQQNPDLVEQFRRQFQGANGAETDEHPTNTQNGPPQPAAAAVDLIVIE